MVSDDERACREAETVVRKGGAFPHVLPGTPLIEALRVPTDGQSGGGKDCSLSVMDALTRVAAHDGESQVCYVLRSAVIYLS